MLHPAIFFDSSGGSCGRISWGNSQKSGEIPKQNTSPAAVGCHFQPDLFVGFRSPSMSISALWKGEISFINTGVLVFSAQPNRRELPGLEKKSRESEFPPTEREGCFLGLQSSCLHIFGFYDEKRGWRIPPSLMTSSILFFLL